MRTVQALTLEEAKTIADGAEAKAIELGLNVTITIMDEHGNLKLYRRMDGSPFLSVSMSQLKALTSSSLPVSTKALAERNASLENKSFLAVPGIVLLEGGLPIITKEGHHVGSIGVSGAASEQDAICAQSGLDQIKSKLKS